MGEIRCKNCGGKLVVKSTKKTAEQLQKAYYYRAYYWCPTCQKLYHDEKFKVTNRQRALSIEHGVKNALPSALRSTPDIEIWTDGSCVHNGTPRARAAWAFVAGKTEKAGLVEGKQTNNVAEGLAIYHALVWAAAEGFKIVKVHTDSQISLYNVAKHHSQVKVNREIFEQIAKVIEKNALQVTFVKVRGHAGDPNNERVDTLANTLAVRGVTSPR